MLELRSLTPGGLVAGLPVDESGMFDTAERLAKSGNAGERLWAIGAAGQFPDNPRARDIWQSMLFDGNLSNRTAARDALLDAGAPFNWSATAIEDLREQLSEPMSQFIPTLHQLPDFFLERLLLDTNDVVAMTASSALGAGRETSFLAEVYRGGANPVVRRRVVDVLAARPGGPETELLQYAATRDRDPTIRKAAADALRWESPRSRMARLERLAPRLKSGHPGTRIQAVPGWAGGTILDR